MTQANSASPWMVIFILWRREMLRLIRQPVRIAAVLGTAGLLWFVLGSGFADSFTIGNTTQATIVLTSGEAESIGKSRLNWHFNCQNNRGRSSNHDLSYSGFLLPGVMTLAAMFTAIFSSISIIEDRNQGWLQSVLVSPAPRWSLAIGHCAGGSTVAFSQAALLMPAMVMTDLRPGAVSIALALLALAITSIALTAVGLIFAWRCETTAGYHAVMNLVFLPMWALSGSMFPTGGAAPWLAWVMRLNPLTWCTHAVRNPLTGEAPGLWLAAAAAFALAMLAIATAIVARPLRP